MTATFIKTAAACVCFFAATGLAVADPVAPGGKIVQIDRVNANTTDVYSVTLAGRELTRFQVAGDGGTCLELRVYDEFDNLVACDTLGMGDRRTAFVTPKFTGKFTVKIRNLGAASNKYVMVID